MNIPTSMFLNAFMKGSGRFRIMGIESYSWKERYTVF